MELLKVENVSYSIRGLALNKDINLEVKKGYFTGIIGPNGSGKSTLLKQIYRVLSPTEGAVYLSGTDISALSNRETAQRMGVLAQENQTDFEFTVEEIVLMGRAPYHTLFQRETPEDLGILDAALDKVRMTSKRHQAFATLSGGEKQRVLLARALAQQTGFLILDEPTNHLDIGYQFQMMELLAELPLTILSAVHDLNLAARFCNWLILLDDGQVKAQGTPDQVLTEEMIRNVFKVESTIAADTRTGKPQITFMGTKQASALRNSRIGG